jgi:hydroxymethylbilane synthase
MWQANFVAELLKRHNPELHIDLIGMTTTGDKLLDTPLYKVGGKALFVKELERALLDKTGDIAVHSLKDVPHDFVKGLELGCILPREDARDAWICPAGYKFNDIPENSVIGTSSLRRMVQLKNKRPDLQFKPLRGNVGTRLKKCQSGEYDAIVLAYAGLKRLELQNNITEVLDPNICLPATGQGAIGIELRTEDLPIKKLLNSLHDENTANAVIAERSFSKELNGSCQTPIACYATIKNNKIELTARLGAPSNCKIIETFVIGDVSSPESIGFKAAQDLIAQGGKEILSECR